MKAHCNEHSKRIQDEYLRQKERLDKLDEQFHQQTELLITIKELTCSVKSIQEELKEHTEKLAEIESRDGETFRAIRLNVITTIIGLILGYILCSIGM